MIELEAITKIYPNPITGRSVAALKGCDLRIRKGSFSSIIGPSGAGKSTLMRIIGGLEKPTSGKVNVLSKEIDLLPKKELYAFRNKNIGFLYQVPQHNLILDLTVIKNITTIGKLFGLTLEEAKRKGYELLERIGIKELAQKKARQLSMGEGMRASLAVCLTNEPQVILADEPTGQLDKQNTFRLLELLKELNKDEKQTILVVSHNPIYFSVVNQSFLIVNGRLGASLSREDFAFTKESAEGSTDSLRKFITHIDSYSYLFLPEEVKDYLYLGNKARFIIDERNDKVFLENPSGQKPPEQTRKQEKRQITFHSRKRKSSRSIVATENLTKYYYTSEKQLILDSINLQIDYGELVFLVGPSGTGKTTLLNLISGMDFDFQGNISVIETRVLPKNKAAIEQLRSKAIFYSSQYVNLNPFMSLNENIELFCKANKNKEKFYSKEFLVEYLLLDGISNQAIQSYSEGERKRAALLLGLLQQPKLMLVDEPSANLDEINKNRVMQLLTEFVMTTNATVLAVTHDIMSIVPNSRLVEVENGKIKSDKIVTQEMCEKLREKYLNKSL